MTRGEALKNLRLWLLIGAVFLFSAACGIQQQLPSVLDGDAARKMSFFTAMLALGKIGHPALYQIDQISAHLFIPPSFIRMTLKILMNAFLHVCKKFPLIS